MAKNFTNPSCCECCLSSIAICTTCYSHFCWQHFVQHRQTFEKYLNNACQPLSQCLNEFQPIEDNLRSAIDRWEDMAKNEVHNTAARTRRRLDAYIQSYRSHFEEESSDLRQMLLSTASRDQILSRLEKLQMGYERSVNDLFLAGRYDRGPLLSIEAKNTTKERISISGSSYASPQEADDYIAKTTFGDRLIKEPLAIANVGSYWAMGGSDRDLLVQEYESNNLTFFDFHGTKGISMTWHYDLVIRDINWYDELLRFLILLDKQLILFDPLTKHFQEVPQVKPYQSNSFRRCTCHHDRLFIVYWGTESLIELVRINTWETEQRWFSPVTCHVNELITCIRLNSANQLGLCVQDENNPVSRKFRFEIRDIALNILHTLPFYTDSGIFSRVVSLPDLHWALLNVDNCFVFVISRDGDLIDKIDWPHGTMFNIALIGHNTIVIRTVDKVYFYDVEFHKEQ